MLRIVVLDRRVHVVLAVDRDLLLAGGVVKGHLVVAGALVGLGLEAHDHALRRAVCTAGICSAL